MESCSYCRCQLGPGIVIYRWKVPLLCFVPPRVIDYKRENQISHFVLQKGPSRGWGARVEEEILKNAYFIHLCNFAVGVVKSLSSLRATICVFELCFFWGGGAGKRTRRRAIPSSNPKRQRLRQMAWNQARPTSSRFEPGQLLAMVASAEDLSLKPAQCVSPFNYCQPVSLEQLPEMSQGIDTFTESSSLFWPRPLTLETSGTSWQCTTQANTSVLASATHVMRWEVKSGGLQAPEIHSIPSLEKSCIYESWWKRWEGVSSTGGTEGMRPAPPHLLMVVCRGCWALFNMCIWGKILKWCLSARGRIEPVLASFGVSSCQVERWFFLAANATALRKGIWLVIRNGKNVHCRHRTFAWPVTNLWGLNFYLFIFFKWVWSSKSGFWSRFCGRVNSRGTQRFSRSFLCI